MWEGKSATKQKKILLFPKNFNKKLENMFIQIFVGIIIYSFYLNNSKKSQLKIIVVNAWVLNPIYDTLEINVEQLFLPKNSFAKEKEILQWKPPKTIRNHFKFNLETLFQFNEDFNFFSDYFLIYFWKEAQ